MQAVNVWMGASVAGASSGLHHDFHDNLYVLLAGTKRFRLFPPALADRMYTCGAVDRIHPNGRRAPPPPLGCVWLPPYWCARMSPRAEPTVPLLQDRVQRGGRCRGRRRRRCGCPAVAPQAAGRRCSGA